MIPVTSFAGKTVAVFGLGGSGLASCHALKAGGADVIAGDFAFEMPDGKAEARVDGVDVVGDGEIENAVHFERCGFDALAVRAIDPRERELIHVIGVDLVERRVTSAGVIAIVGGPGVGRLFLNEGLRI